MKTIGIIAASVFMLLTAVNSGHEADLRSVELTPGDSHPLARNTAFVTGNPSGFHDPGTDKVKASSRKKTQSFKDVRISFRQLCFSFSQDGAGAHQAAARAFLKVSGQPVDFDAGISNLADHSTLPSYYGDQTPEQVVEVFGTRFAQSLFQLKPGSWQRPIESGLGWHLVWIDSIASGRDPVLADAEGEVRSE
jgi:peptidyl-prolyl cis-trans isomerase C